VTPAVIIIVILAALLLASVAAWMSARNKAKALARSSDSQGRTGDGAEAMTAAGEARRSVEAELDRLRGNICEMGGLAEAAIHDAMLALVRHDEDAAATVVDRDERIDAFEGDIERQAIAIIADRAPPADELREVIAALKIASVVERIGDYAKNIAKRVPALQGSDIAPVSLLPEMARIAGEMVHDVLDAFAARDAAKAASVCERDSAVDNFYNSIFRALLTHMMENPNNITPATHLLFIAKNLERIGDHATNVAEMVHFAATGRHLAERPRGIAVTDIVPADLGPVGAK
jgi:phosphate transport system protein